MRGFFHIHPVDLEFGDTSEQSPTPSKTRTGVETHVGHEKASDVKLRNGKDCVFHLSSSRDFDRVRAWCKGAPIRTTGNSWWALGLGFRQDGHAPGEDP